MPAIEHPDEWQMVTVSCATEQLTVVPLTVTTPKRKKVAAAPPAASGGWQTVGEKKRPPAPAVAAAAAAAGEAPGSVRGAQPNNAYAALANKSNARGKKAKTTAAVAAAKHGEADADVDADQTEAGYFFIPSFVQAAFASVY